MVGKKGCSGGRRPGAGRKAGTAQIKSKPKSKGVKKASKKDDGTPDASSMKKLTSFFSTLPVAQSAQPRKKLCAPRRCPQFPALLAA